MNPLNPFPQSADSILFRTNKIMNQPSKIQPDAKLTQAIAEAVRMACIEAALDGYEIAAMNGLCHEGAWEAAISAMQTLDVKTVLQAVSGDQNSSR